jgi:hypothetical protein
VVGDTYVDCFEEDEEKPEGDVKYNLSIVTEEAPFGKPPTTKEISV